MQKFYTDYKGQLRNGNVELFLQISIDIYLRILKYEKELIDLREKIDLNAEAIKGPFLPEKQRKIFDRISTLNREKYKNNIQGIVLLASYYEALINEIGRIELGSKYFSKNLDKLSVLAKWEVVLQLIYSESLKTDSQHFEMMKIIVGERNNLVHYKTQVIQKPTLEEKRKGYELTKKHMKIFLEAIKSLSQFHNELLTLDKSKGILKLFQFSKEVERI